MGPFIPTSHEYQTVDDENDDILVSVKRWEYISAMVIKKLVVDFVPPSLVVYIAKRIYEMRLWSVVSDEEINSHCELCARVVERLVACLRHEKQDLAVALAPLAACELLPKAGHRPIADRPDF